MDLKVKDVAELLSFSEEKIHNLISEGSLPAYRLNNEYLFNRMEIEEWLLQEKIEIAGSGNMQFSLFRALYRGGVMRNVKGETKEEVFHAVMQEMSNRFDLDADVLTELFLDREKMMPTTLGHGIGVPHTRDFLLDTHFDVIFVAYLDKPLEYGALDAEPVQTLFFLFAAQDRNHLNLLAKIAHLSSSEKSRSFYKTQPSKEDLLDYVKEWEGQLKH